LLRRPLKALQTLVILVAGPFMLVLIAMLVDVEIVAEGAI
jgi:choline-glycine betaine transporter